jgi:hypothetical protein
MSTHPIISYEDRGSSGLTVTLLGAGSVPIKAVINIQQTHSSSGKNDIEAIPEFYRGNTKVDNILELEESSELLDLIAFYQASVKDKKLLIESIQRKKEEKHSTNIIARMTSPFKEVSMQYRYARDFLFRSWVGGEMVNIYTINQGGDGTNADKIIARTVIEVDADVLTVINSKYFSSRLMRYLFLLHLSNVALAGQLVAMHTREGLSDIVTKLEKSGKRALWYAGLSGFGFLEFISLALFTISNGRYPSFSEEWTPIVWPLIWPAIAIVLRIISPRIILFVVRHAIKKFMKNNNP